MQRLEMVMRDETAFRDIHVERTISLIQDGVEVEIEHSTFESVVESTFLKDGWEILEHEEYVTRQACHVYRGKARKADKEVYFYIEKMS